MNDLGKRGMFFLVFLFCFDNDKIKAQSVTLYVFPPAHQYRWNHPHSLLVSAVKNYYFSSKKPPVRLVGHLVIELKKDSTSIFTAITDDDFTGFKRDILKNKIGLAVLFKPEPGHLENADQIQAEIRYRTRESKAAFISFNISDSAYRYLKLYIDSFKIKGYDKLYNGLNDPRAGKGSGCTAFGISFLELVNALSQEYRDEWAIKVNVPEKLIGDTVAKKKVSLWRIFFTFRWAGGNKPSRPLNLYEPYLVYRWINKVWDNEKATGAGRYRLKKMGRAKGIERDCWSCSPQFPMFTR
ncbi:MAG TPA: hypothetical protein VK489_03140 [Ferruginibacter sp.]|nr:hypothetical protein [Ferruginibacter sp.]